MTDSLNYILQRIEHKYLQENKGTLITSDAVCLQDENLPCNCITGIVINYSAFLTRTCLSEDAYKSTIGKADQEHYYIQCCRGTNLVCPVIALSNDTEPYIIGNRLCRKSKGPEAYVPFRSYDELERIENELTEYKKQSILTSLTSNRVLSLEFWIQFLSAMRVKPLDVTSKAFLFMAIYFFPNRTLNVMWDSKETLEPEWLEMFIKDYLIFLLNIGGDKKLGFYQRFSQAFKTSMEIDISAFVEDLSSHFEGKKDLFLEILITAYIYNVNEISRRSGLFKRFCSDYLKGRDVEGIYHELRDSASYI